VLVPDEYRTNLETLCDQACTSPYDKVKATVESSLGKPIDEIFSYFNPIPIKSASIA
jgi:predicted unusual protein kinase regulating ubiquinone biosynthesis (AarF/ABC1/UbiB family)